jgi:hypothetical protein
MIDRLWNPENTEGPLTIPDILAAQIGPATKLQFIGLAEKQAAGADLDYLDDGLVNDLYRRVHDPNSPNPITEPSQLLPYIGNGLPRAEAEKLRADIERLQEPGAREADALFTEFLKRAESSITKTSLFGKDAKGDQNMLAFRVRVQRLWEKELQEGSDPLELINPASPSYIGNIIPQYMRTPQQQAIDQVEAMRGVEIEGTEIPPRLEGESVEAYLKRVSP